MCCHVILVSRLAVSPPADEGDNSHITAPRWPAEGLWRLVDGSSALARAPSAVIQPRHPLRNVGESYFPAGIWHLGERGFRPGVSSPRRCDMHRLVQLAIAAPVQAEDAPVSPAGPAEATVGEAHTLLVLVRRIFFDPAGQQSRDDRGDEHLPVGMLQAVLDELAVSVPQIPVAQGRRHFSLDCKREHHAGLICEYETVCV